MTDEERKALVERLRSADMGWPETDEVELQRSDAHEKRIAELEAALRDMVDAVCDDTGFAAAVRADSGLAYPWHPLELAERKARAALGEAI